jgi:hypothetical protein
VKTKYLPKTTSGKIARLAEECAEVGMACDKTLRVYLEWHAGDIQGALGDYNPDLPPKERESNRQWILREIADLKHAIKEIEKALK